MTSAVAPPSDASLVLPCPFVGLVPYGLEDAEWFFGREADSRLIADNLIAYELTLLYGPSGVGKSSLLNAGVLNELERQKAVEIQRGRSPFVTVIHRTWQEQPIIDLKASIDRAAIAQLGPRAEPPPQYVSLAEHLASWTGQLHASLYIILDQFEEYFLYHGRPDDPQTIEMAEAISTYEDGTNFLVAMREDALAKLDRFEGLIPDLFENYYRVEHLDTAAARSAVDGAVRRFNELYPRAGPVMIEPELIDEVVESVMTGNVVLGRAGVGRSEADSSSDAVETAQLQLVLTRLWEEEIGSGARAIRAGTLRRLGGAEAVIRNHLADGLRRIDEPSQRMALDIFSHLVTPSGSKIAHTVDDLASYADVSPETMLPVVERLSAGDLRILRPVAPAADRLDSGRYEIFHDVLAGPIVDWSKSKSEAIRAEEARAEQEAELGQARAAARVERRRRILATLAAVLLVVAAGAAFVLWLASEREQEAGRSREAAATALDQLVQDPAAAAEQAVAALRMSPTALAERALRRTLPDLSVSLVLSGHTDALFDAEFSPDGTMVATGSADGTARIWDAETGDQLHVLEGHRGQVFDVEFSADGSSLLTLADDPTVRIWDVASGKQRSEIATPGPLQAASFDPSGAVVATGGNSSVITIWNASTGEAIATLDHGDAEWVWTLSFGQFEGRNLLVSGDSLGALRVWDADRWTLEGRVDLGSLVNTTRFTPDGSLVLSGIYRQDLPLVWDWTKADGQPTTGFPPPDTVQLVFDHSNPSGVVHVISSGESGLIATTGDRTTQLWSMAEVGQALEDAETSYVFNPTVLDGHVNWVTDAAWSPDGEILATSASEGRVLVWDGQTGGFLAELRGHEGAVNQLAFSSTNQIVTASSDRTARIWQPPRDLVFRGHLDWALDFAIDPDGELLVSASSDGTVRGYDAATAELRWVIDEGGDGTLLGELFAVAISPDSRHLATGGFFGTVRVWDITTDEPTEVASWTPNRAIFDLAFDRTGDWIAVSTDTGAVHVWPWQSDDHLRSLIGHRTWSVVEFSPIADVVATAGGEGSVRLWSPTTGLEARRMDGHQGGTVDLAYSPDGRLLVTAGEDRSVKLWVVATGRMVNALIGHEYPVTSVDFDPTGRLIVSGDQGGNVAVWDAESGALLSLQRKHEVFVNRVSFGPDNRIVSAGDDDIVRSYPCSTCGSTDELMAMVDERLPRLPEAAPQSRALTFTTELSAGTCTLAPEPGETFDRLDRVDCGEPHGVEFFAAFSLVMDQESDPGDDAVENEANRACEGAIGAYVDGPLPGQYRIRSFTPTPEAWEFGARSINCGITRVDGGTWAGSLRVIGGD